MSAIGAHINKEAIRHGDAIGCNYPFYEVISFVSCVWYGCGSWGVARKLNGVDVTCDQSKHLCYCDHTETFCNRA